MSYYEFIAIDEGRQNLLRTDTKGKVRWKISLEDYPTPRAMEHLDSGTFLMGYDRGYCLVDTEKGEVVHDCSRWTGITGAGKTADGSTLLAGLNLEGLEGVCVLTLDTRDRLSATAVCEGDYVRLMTITEKNLLLSTNDHIRVCGRDLKTEKTLEAEGFLHAWKSLCCPDGTTLVSGGYGAFMARFSQDGELLATFGRRGTLPEEVNPFFYAAFCLTPENTILLANWQGHGPDNGHKGRQLLHFSYDGEFLESWSFPETISSLQGLLIL